MNRLLTRVPKVVLIDGVIHGSNNMYMGSTSLELAEAPSTLSSESITWMLCFVGETGCSKFIDLYLRLVLQSGRPWEIVGLGNVAIPGGKWSRFQG